MFAIPAYRHSLFKGGGAYVPLTSRGIAVMGDSRTDQLSGGSFAANGSPTIDQASYNLYAWMQNLSFGRFPVWGEYATGGYTSQQVIDNWLSAAIASRPFAIAFVGVGNDPAYGITEAGSKANIDTIHNAVTSAGIKLILLTDPGFENYSSAAMTWFHKVGGVNDHIRAKHNLSSGVCVIDIVPTLLQSPFDPILFNTDMSYDSPKIHWSAKAAVALGQQINTELDATGWWPATPVRDRSNNALVNPDFATATGGTLGTGNSGALPASFTGVGVTSSEWAQTFSVNVRGDGDAEVVSTAVKSSGTSLRDIYFSQSVVVASGGTLGGVSLSPGDYVSCGCLMDIDSGHSKLLGVFSFLNISFSGGTPAFDQAYNGKIPSSASGTPIPGGAYELELYTRPYKIPSGWSTNMTLAARFGIQMKDADTVTYRARRLWLKKVAPNDLASTY